MENILIHTCCGPCSIMPLQALLKNKFLPTAYFFNPNIHLQDEFLLRLFAMQKVTEHYDIPLVFAGNNDYFKQLETSKNTHNEQRLQYKDAIMACAEFLYSHMQEEKMRKSIQKILKKWENYAQEFSFFKPDEMLAKTLIVSHAYGDTDAPQSNSNASNAYREKSHGYADGLAGEVGGLATSGSTDELTSKLAGELVNGLTSKLAGELANGLATSGSTVGLTNKLANGLANELKVDSIAWVSRLKEYKEGERCKICYQERLYQSALYAAKNGFQSFTTSLLYSRYQNHDDICSAAQDAMAKVNKEIQENMVLNAQPVKFYYYDFREYWQEGIDLAKNMGLYRQKWCGCALSRIESLERMAKREYEKN